MSHDVRMISIAIEGERDGEEAWMQVPARVRGNLAIVKSPKGFDHYALTHVPTGRAIIKFLREQDALLALDHLGAIDTWDEKPSEQSLAYSALGDWFYYLYNDGPHPLGAAR